MGGMDEDVTTRAIVDIGSGKISGTDSRGIRRFLGVPYAEPPFGERRFALPVPAAPWTDIRDCSVFGPTAPQSPYAGPIAKLLGSVEIAGEDILTVNVWTPSDASPASLPVVVWFHGGAHERGTPALAAYDGSTFARDGVVFVSVGHRVGAEGFSVLDGAPRNLGLSDAAAGLQWVEREIAAFGGDPARITVMGESAGGALVAALLARDDTRSIPAGAIIQSGPLEAVTAARAARVTRAIAKLVDAPATRAGFLAVPPDVLLLARRRHAAGSSPLRGAPGYALAIDPESLPVSPALALRDTAVPLIIGTNTDEYRLWLTPGQLAAITPLHLSLARLAARIPRRTLANYRAALPAASAGELLGQVVADRLLRAPAVRLADARPERTFVYEFAWPSPVRDLRAAHALEIGFVFDRPHAEDTVAMAGPDAPVSLATRMHGDWVRFIRSGDPGWPAFGPDRRVQVFDTEPHVAPLPRAAAVDSLPR